MSRDGQLRERIPSTAPVHQRAPEVLRVRAGLIRARWLYGWQLASLGEQVMIGPGCRFVNGHRTVIGDHCSIQGPGRFEVVLLERGQPHGPLLEIGEGVSIEQNVHIVASRRVFIGNAVSVSANVSIVDLTHPHYGAAGRSASAEVLASDREVRIGAGVFLGVGAVVLPGVEIGEGARVGANAVVTRSVASYATVAGVPARPVD